jgi:hypothetical protein
MASTPVGRSLPAPEKGYGLGGVDAYAPRRIVTELRIRGESTRGGKRPHSARHRLPRRCELRLHITFGMYHRERQRQRHPESR